MDNQGEVDKSNPECGWRYNNGIYLAAYAIPR